MSKRIQKALRDLNGYIDDDRQKLCDRIKKLERSHKRMIRLLKMIHFYLFPKNDDDYIKWPILARENKFYCDLIKREIERKVL